MVMNKSEIIQQMIRELKLYREYLLNMKTIINMQKEETGKKIIKK